MKGKQKMIEQNLHDRISDALETLLFEIYTENGIETGDIDPMQALEWHTETWRLAYLFRDLIKQNKPL